MTKSYSRLPLQTSRKAQMALSFLTIDLPPPPEAWACPPPPSGTSGKLEPQPPAADPAMRPAGGLGWNATSVVRVVELPSPLLAVLALHCTVLVERLGKCRCRVDFLVMRAGLPPPPWRRSGFKKFPPSWKITSHHLQNLNIFRIRFTKTMA